MTRTVLSALLLGLVALPALAQDGTWTGRMRCDAIPGMTSAPLNAAVTVTVAGGIARYERDVQGNTGQNRGQGESGQGRVGADGSVVLEGRVQGQTWSYAARRTGR